MSRRPWADPAGLGHGETHVIRFDTDKIDQSEAAGKGGSRGHGYRQGQPGLAHATRAHNGHHPRAGQCLAQLLRLATTSDEAGQRHRKRRSGLPGKDRAVLGRETHQAPMVGDPELSSQVRHVGFDGARGNEQLAADLLVREVSTEQFQDRPLPWCDRIQVHPFSIRHREVP